MCVCVYVCVCVCRGGMGVCVCVGVLYIKLSIPVQQRPAVILLMYELFFSSLFNDIHYLDVHVCI